VGSGIVEQGHARRGGLRGWISWSDRRADDRAAASVSGWQRLRSSA
jgi:hypothetical protein